MSFENKVVFITGASSGFGKAISIKFAKLSATLALIDINGENLEKCAEICKSLNGGKVLKHVIDLRNDELVQKVVDKTVKELKRIDIVVNCAGVLRNNHGSILDSKTMENYDEVMAINLRALVRVTNCVAPILVETKGCLINIASIAANMLTTDSFSYFISKSAVCHLTKCVALELGLFGVRANAILPGAASTNIILNSGKSSEENDRFWEKIKSLSPLNTLVDTENVANMAVFLASDRAKNVTGSDFTVDAGLSMIQTIKLHLN